MNPKYRTAAARWISFFRVIGGFALLLAPLAGMVLESRAASGALAPAPLVDLPKGVALISTAGGRGQWLELCAAEPFSEQEFAIGRVPAVERYVANGRVKSSCWMEPTVGDTLATLPRETQFLLLRLRGDQYLAMVPLLDGAFRCSLRGDENGVLQLLAESGDRATTTNRLTGLYLEEGRDPYELVRSAAAQVRARQHAGEPAALPQAPDFIRYLGWCSWNAFYADVSDSKIRQALDQFRAGGVMPGFVVIDAGWFQSTNNALCGYAADPAKFPDGFGATIRVLKQTNGVSRVLVWHTFNGYWRGADPQALAGIGIRMVQPRFSSWVVEGKTTARTAARDATVTKTFYPGVYRQPIGQPDLGKFYSTFHKQLHDVGVDGVKIDAMTWVETLGAGQGGRVCVMHELVAATTRSEQAFFHSNVIWCSSCSSDCILQAPRSALMRSSGDFFPDKPESHGRHVVINAHGSLWLGEFVIPDWDMFQSGHSSGAFHAAARAISGGPVYITDELGKTDFALLRKLSLSDRTVPLCLGPARPSPDSLFLDPAREKRLFKIFNHNPAGGGVLGVFNCSYQTRPVASVRCKAGVDDVYGLAGGEFAVYQHVAGTLRCMQRTEAITLALTPLHFELFMFAPIKNGFAAIGLTDKFNSGGCITAVRHGERGRVEVDLRDGGEFLAWSESRPRSVKIHGMPTPFHFEKTTGSLRMNIPRGGAVTLIIE